MKRTISKLLIFSCLCAFLIPYVSATEIQPYASDYFLTYSVSASSPSSKELKIRYDITPAGLMDQLGVSKIRVYKSNGSLVRTITGTTSNGLLHKNTGNRVIDTYSVNNLTSGQSYYAEVDIYAKDSGGSDSRTLTTYTVKIT